MMTDSLDVVLFGGSGFVGRGLRTRLVAEGHRVTVVGRGRDTEHDGWREVRWDARTPGAWTAALDRSDVVVHLVGKRVDCRPTTRNIDELIDTREGTVRLVGEALGQIDHPPAAWIQLSSLAIFGDAGDEVIDESTPIPPTGPRQQVEVCRRWEAAFHDAADGIARRVLLRPGISIGGRDDPATAQLTRLARLGLGGPVGSGEQWVSWIAADDLFAFLHHAVVDDAVNGLYHLSSPTPVRNREMMAAYRSAVDRRLSVPSPSFITTIGAWLLGSDPALALTGRRGVPRRLLDEGWRFECDRIEDAVRSAVVASR
ncbi:MAG: NAD-dependent epimerase/dehydratase family protein [Actinomycetota bacterium]